LEILTKRHRPLRGAQARSQGKPGNDATHVQ